MSDIDRPTEKYCCQYYHDGCWWGILIDAYDDEDAAVRARKLGLQLDGRLIAVIPGRLGWAADVLCWIRNCWISVRNLFIR
jgi:hypothetical protein